MVNETTHTDPLNEGRLARLDQQLAAVRDLYRQVGNDGWGREDLITLVYSTRILVAMLDGVPAELRRLRARLVAVERPRVPREGEEQGMDWFAQLQHAWEALHTDPAPPLDPALLVVLRWCVAKEGVRYTSIHRPAPPPDLTMPWWDRLAEASEALSAVLPRGGE